MTYDPRRARDLRLLDLVDAHPRRAHSGALWRVVREGRDPLQGGRSPSRWCNGTFDVLYTSLERDGAIAEIHELLSLQPVFPSKMAFRVHRLNISIEQCLHLSDLETVGKLGVDVGRHAERNCGRTQDVADAAYFLGFDRLLAPNARWSCMNAVLFTEKIAPACLLLEATDPDPVDWAIWRRRGAPGATRPR